MRRGDRRREQLLELGVGLREPVLSLSISMTAMW
jgi:hypothetical protein